MAKKTMTFEESISRLEEIVDLLENGKLPLEDALKAFEEGTALVKKCTTQLNQAELNISKLVSSFEEKPEEEKVNDYEQI